MTVKDLLIALCFLASAFLVVFGGWNYMKGRINQYEETAKAENLATQGYNAEEALQKIRKSKTNSLILFAAGVTGLFLIVTHASRRRNRIITSTKQIIKENHSGVS
jgi:TRAP-type C4-dicarboxylate transport system permease small subunit